MQLTFVDDSTLNLDQPRVMGILNVTPDSFSDGGRFEHVDAAVAHGLQMIEQGADLIDLGGESTRPGSQPVPPDEQIRRVVPVIEQLCQQMKQTGRVVPISIDTQHPQVARAALKAGAMMVNDVNAGRTEGMLQLLADHRVPIVLMHMQGTPATMQFNPHYDDVVNEVITYLQARAAAAITAGVSPEKIMLDPGIGFGKTVEHNLTLLARLHRLTALGYPVLLGVSRKRFLGRVGHLATRTEPPMPGELLPGSLAVAVGALMQGVRLFRVHDVAEHRQALDVAWAVQQSAGLVVPSRERQ